jgi:hypothetical protein
MTQQMLVGYGPTGFRLTMTGPEGPVEAMLGVGSAGPVASLLTFNTISAGAAGSGRLVDIPTPDFLALPKGTLAYTGNSSATVSSVMALWLRMTSPTAISSDGINILKPLGGASREIWVRQPNDAAAAYWASRYQVGGVSIDAVNGSDENFGNAGAPLQTWAEFLRRIANAPFPNGITVTIVGDLGTADVLDTRNLAGPLTVVGTLTPVLPGLAIAGAGYTPRVAATNTPNQLTCSTALVWTTHCGSGQFIKMTSGAANGLLATAAVDVGGNRARVGTFQDATGAEIQPAAADTFDIVAASQVTRVIVGGPSPVAFQNLRFVTNAPEIAFATPFYATNAKSLQFINCCFDQPTIFPGTFTCIGCQGMLAVGASSATVFACLGAAWSGGVLFDAANGSYSVNGMSAITFSAGALFQGCSLACSGGYATTNDCAFFDTVATAILVRRGGTLQARSTWGNTGAGNPFACTLDRSSSLLLRGASQTLTNATPNEIAMPVTASTTWAAARAAVGIKDAATSNASIMVVT